MELITAPPIALLHLLPDHLPPCQATGTKPCLHSAILARTNCCWHCRLFKSTYYLFLCITLASSQTFAICSTLGYECEKTEHAASQRQHLKSMMSILMAFPCALPCRLCPFLSARGPLEIAVHDVPPAAIHLQRCSSTPPPRAGGVWRTAPACRGGGSLGSAGWGAAPGLLVPAIRRRNAWPSASRGGGWFLLRDPRLSPSSLLPRGVTAAKALDHPNGVDVRAIAAAAAFLL